MDGLLTRLLAAAFVVALGGFAGYLAGHAVQWPVIGAVLGCVTGMGFVVVVDAWRARRLVRWLSGEQEDPAPRDTGMWGELGYRVERAIRLREKRMHAEQTRLAEFISAMEASPNGVLLLDAADQITWCNAVAAEHFGLDRLRDRLQPVTNLVRAPAFVALLEGGLDAEPARIPERHGRGTLSVLVRGYGEGLRLVLSQDVTERERADAMRRDFVANVSHEIRTPLTVLAGFVETLDTLTLTDVERRRVLALMTQQTQRMQTLVNDLLTLAQLEGSPPPPVDRWVEVDKLLTQAQGDGQALSKGRHQLGVVTSGGVQIAGLESELLSAVGNLVTNAVRYTPEGGRIEIAWQRRADGAGEIAVRDDGIGIAREHVARLAERFYRVDSSRSRETGGTGLGLAIVKHVVQRHGGELEIHSEHGKGSTFCIVLPAPRVRVVSPATGQGADARVA